MSIKVNVAIVNSIDINKNVNPCIYSLVFDFIFFKI